MIINFGLHLNELSAANGNKEKFMKDFKQIGHLCIKLKTGDSFKIGDDIRITRLACTSHETALRIQAPKNIPILRDKAIKREASNE